MLGTQLINIIESPTSLIAKSLGLPSRTNYTAETEGKRKEIQPLLPLKTVGVGGELEDRVLCLAVSVSLSLPDMPRNHFVRHSSENI